MLYVRVVPRQLERKNNMHEIVETIVVVSLTICIVIIIVGLIALVLLLAPFIIDAFQLLGA